MKISIFLRTIVILSMCLFTGLELLAQDIKEEKTYPYELSTKEEVIKFNILKKIPSRFKPQMNHIYYWFINNSIHKNNGGIGGKLLHGKYSSYNINMSLKESGVFCYGEKKGIWISWFPNGYIASKTHWKNGLLHGKSIIYSEDLRQWVQSTYKYGKLNGIQKSYTNSICDSSQKYKNGVRILPKVRQKKINTDEKHSKKNKTKPLPTPKKKHIKEASKKEHSGFFAWIKKFFSKKNKTEKL